jgi:hypothetical protein
MKKSQQLLKNSKFVLVITDKSEHQVFLSRGDDPLFLWRKGKREQGTLNRELLTEEE